MIVPQSVKVTTDTTVMGSSLLGFFKLIPWPELAACAAFVYTVLRIAELIRDWRKKK